MKIAVTTLGSDGGLSGIGRYTSTLLQQWTSMQLDLRLFAHADDRSAFAPGAPDSQWVNVSDRWRLPVSSVFWHQALLPGLCKDVDVLFLPAGNRRLPARHSVPSVGTIHDCSSLHIQGKYDRARDLYIKKVLPWLMQRLDHVVTVSESTRRDLVESCGVRPENITVVPLAADRNIFFPHDPALSISQLKTRYGIHSPFFLYTSRIEHPGKNHVRLIEAFSQLKQRQSFPHQLVFVGPDKERASEVHLAAASSPFAADILFTGPVPGDDLPLLYSAAQALVFPSLYEGFGLPLLEAMACGTPVACSNRSSLPEVGGASALLFDPGDPQCIAAAMEHLLAEDASARDRRVADSIVHAATFSWERTALATLNVLRQVSGVDCSLAQPAAIGAR